MGMNYEYRGWTYGLGGPEGMVDRHLADWLAANPPLASSESWCPSPDDKILSEMLADFERQMKEGK